MENAVKSVIASVRGKTINDNHLNVIIRSIRRKHAVETTEEAVSTRSLPAAIEQLQRQLIEQDLRDRGGNNEKAGQVLRLSRHGLIKKRQRLGHVES